MNLQLTVYGNGEWATANSILVAVTDLHLVHGSLLDIRLRDQDTGPLIPSTADTYQQAG